MLGVVTNLDEVDMDVVMAEELSVLLVLSEELESE